MENTTNNNDHGGTTRTDGSRSNEEPYRNNAGDPDGDDLHPMSTSQRQTAGTSVRSHPQSSGGLRPVVNAVSIQATRVSSERNLDDRHHLQISMATAVSGTDLDLKNDDEIVELEIYRSSSIPGNQGKLLHILHISLIIWIIIANNATMAI